MNWRLVILAALWGTMFAADQWMRRRLIDVRRWLLLTAAELGFGFGLSYLISPQDSLPIGLSPLPEWGLRLYAVGWLVSAGLCVWLAITNRRTMGAIAWVGAPPFMWAIVYSYSFYRGYDQGLRGLVLYYLLSALIFSVAYWTPVGGWRTKSAAAAAVGG